MITSQKAVEIIKNRNLQLIPMIVEGAIAWRARTMEGSRAGEDNKSYPSPEEAVEAADLWFSLFEEREKKRKDSVIISALERGDYFVRSRELSVTNDQGQTVAVRVFSVYLPDGSLTDVRDEPTLAQAVVKMEKSREELPKKR